MYLHGVVTGISLHLHFQHLRGVLQLDNCPSLDVQELLQNQINSSEGINNSLGMSSCVVSVSVLE